MIDKEKKNMKIHEKYLEALKTFDGFVTVSEWAVKFGEMYPELLEKAIEIIKNDSKWNEIKRRQSKPMFFL